MSKQTPKLPTDSTAPLSHNPFAKLQALRSDGAKEAPPPAAPVMVRPGPTSQPAGGKPDAKPAAKPAIAAPASSVITNPDGKGPAWAVIRLERKGRGGKEATVVEKLGLKPGELEHWCKDLKAALGCGGAVEGDVIVLQGDLRQRLSPLLTKRGVRKVTLG